MVKRKTVTEIIMAIDQAVSRRMSMVRQEDPWEDVSVRDKVLCVAEMMPRGKPFTKEDLCIAAWEEFPMSFGTIGRETQFPDPRRVRRTLIGTGNLLERGLLAESGADSLVLTKTGLERVRQIGRLLNARSKS